MNPDDPEAADEQFSELLAAYDEALASGQPPFPATPCFSLREAAIDSQAADPSDQAQ
jgi:hypothetical protein